jgi:hypothetical protein
MTVDSGNLRPGVYAPTVEFTLAANAGRKTSFARTPGAACVYTR